MTDLPETPAAPTLSSACPQPSHIGPAEALQEAFEMLESPSRARRLRAEILGCSAIDELFLCDEDLFHACAPEHRSFVARALSRDGWGEVEHFISLHGGLVMDVRAGILRMHSTDRSMAIESLLQGFASQTSAADLSRLPALAARMRLSGSISDSQAFCAMSIALHRFRLRRREALYG